MRELVSLVTCTVAATLMFHGAAPGAVMFFDPMDISDDGSGLIASASAVITTGPGYVEVLLQNTSPRQDDFQGSGESASPFITELAIQVKDYEVLIDSCYARSTPATLFAQGQGNPATAMGVRNLHWYGAVLPHMPETNKVLVYTEAGVTPNDNVIGSANVLDADNIPQEGFAVGFLNPSPDGDNGAVFDSVLFHFALNMADTPDATYWETEDALVVKFQGGGDYSMRGHVPEPATLMLIAVGVLPILSGLRRKRS